MCDADGNCECDENSEACDPIALCADGNSACEATCSGCLIQGQCVAPQALAADNPCQICDPSRDAAGWSSNDGASCEDGLFCTIGDVCAGGQCTASPRICDDGVACNGTSTCDETLDACTEPVSQCPAGTLCDVATDTCASTCAGCSIDGVCLTAGAERPGNPCFVCDPALSTSAYSPSLGKACGAPPTDCSLQDTCDAAGVCQPNHALAETACGNATANACDQPDSCDGAGNCLTRTAANASPCDDGSFCTVGDQCQGGACVATGNRNCGAGLACNEAADQCQCQGCVVGAQCFAAGAVNGANTCEICDPPRSTTAFSANVGANCGSGPTECSAQDTCNAQRQCSPNDLPVGTPCSSALGGRCQADGRCSDELAGRAPVLLADIAMGIGGLVISGAAAESQVGGALGGGGDVNGDGFDDLVIGASGVLSDPGRAYVVFGRAGQSSISLADIEAGRGGFVIVGGADDVRLGGDVLIAGDVNGDGLADLLIGAASDTDYVVFGKRETNPVLAADIASGSGGGFPIRAASDDGATGGDIAAAGDINGDGLADLLFSVRGDQPGARLVFGKASFAPVDLALTPSTGLRVVADRGLDVGGAGDVNGDGFDDIIVGSTSGGTAGATGAAYVLFGSASGFVPQIAALEAGQAGGFVINGVRAGDQTGSHVTSAGDVNADGLDDVLVSAIFAASNGNLAAGRAHVVFGKANNVPVELSALEAGVGGGFSVNGLATNDNAGTSLLALGDVNGDGFGDIVVASPQASRGGSTAAGVTSVVFGKADSDPVALGDLEQGLPGGLAILSNGVVPNNGQVVARADFNGDNRMDIAIGDSASARVLVVLGQ